MGTKAGRGRRLVVGALSLLLVPVLVFTMPYSAQAATKVSGQKTVTFGSKSWVPQQWVSCSVQAWYVVTGTAAAGYTQVLKTNSGDCSTGVGLNYEGGALAMTWTGLTGSGDPCSGGVSDVILGADEVIPNTTAVMTFLGQPVAATGLCTVTQMCWTLTNSWAGVDWADDGCEPVTMGAPVVPTEGDTSTCPTATMTGAKMEPNPQDTRNPLRWRVTYHLKDVTGGTWNFGAIMDNGSGGYVYTTLIEPVALTPGQVKYEWPPTGSYGGLDPVGEVPKVKGFYMFNTATEYSGSTAPLYHKPFTGWTGRGLHAPSQCHFYFGDKWYDDGDPATTYDTPGGPADGSIAPGASNDPDPAPVAPAPEVKDDACAFSWTDPTTFMCAMGGLFRGLFIPDHAPGWGDVPNPLPNGWLPDFPDLSGGACGPLTLPALDFGNIVGQVGPVQFANTCADPWPLARTITYNGLLASVLVGLLWQGYRAGAAALGMGLPTGGGDDE